MEKWGGEGGDDRGEWSGGRGVRGGTLPHCFRQALTILPGVDGDDRGGVVAEAGLEEGVRRGVGGVV